MNDTYMQQAIDIVVHQARASFPLLFEDLTKY
jgi:hypothetical protein